MARPLRGYDVVLLDLTRRDASRQRRAKQPGAAARDAFSKTNSTPTSSDDQVRVAELVPEISLSQRRVVGALQVPARTAGVAVADVITPLNRFHDLFEQHQVGRLRFVKAGDQSGNRAHRPQL